jgi:Family of unknown function (DUF5330)
MRLLLRMAFWLVVILLLLPAGGSPRPVNANVSASDALTAAKATVTDLRSFCDRQPDACTIGSLALVVIGHRAQAGAKMIYDYLTDRFGPADTGAMGTVSQRKSMPQTVSGSSRDTLVPADLAPTWRVPHARQARRDRPASGAPQTSF